jgi:hypothetical protein
MRYPWQFMGGIFLCLCLAGGPGRAGAPIPPKVTEARDLGVDGGRSQELGAPIVLVVTREDCGYCARLKTAVIVPMILSGEYEDRAIIRELNIDARDAVRDFGGRRVSPFAVANRYDALLTPTVLILGPDGGEVAPRLVGINNEQMYLWYLDRAIEEGAGALAGPALALP